MIALDSQEQIVLAKTYSIIGKYFRKITSNNGDAEVILRCAGLSSLIDEYESQLTPYYYNQGWRNDNLKYSPINACFSICTKIESNKKALGNFLKEIFDRVYYIEEEDFKLLANYLEIIGYELLAEERDDSYENNQYKYRLTVFSSGAIERQNDTSFLLKALHRSHSDIVHCYIEAISNYGNSEYKSCIDNCRSLIENFFKKIDSNSDYAKGILAATGEKIIDNSNTKLTSIKKIFSHWIDKRNGANRYRLFVTMYSAMSGLGTHGEEVPTKEDSLMFLRMTEDALIWCLQKSIGF